MGVNILNKKAIEPLIEKGLFLDMSDLMMKLKENGEPVYSYTEECFWLDMGRHEDYEQANEVFNDRREDFLP